MIDQPNTLERPAQRTAVVHITCPRSEIRKVMGPGYSELMSTLASQAVAPTGRWFTHHLQTNAETFDFEIGVQVAVEVSPSGRVTPSEMPAGRFARVIYRGPYEGLPAAWGEFDLWIRANGFKADVSLWEFYVTDPAVEKDPSKYETELVRPLL